MPKILNKHRDNVKGAIYIGRGSPYGNPFSIGVDGTRDQVCEKYEDWIHKPQQKDLRELIKKNLKGKDLY